ncbi:MAG: phosphoribosylamine--glycine ligase [Eubacteriales bacterium]
MKIMVVGGGGREHAIIRKLKENKEVSIIYALPGNGGIAADAVCVPISATDITGMVDFAVSRRVDFAVVAPDDPLVLGAVDLLQQAGIPCFGPTADAALIEGSKVFAKNLMKQYGIPTADYRTFDSLPQALTYLESAPFPLVVKADGLALGKGVIIAHTKAEAAAALRAMMADKVFGESGARVVVEEYLEGPEVSVLAFTDGQTIRPMVSAMDHKRALECDEGPNTGGMGAVAPNPYYTPEVAERCMKEIFLPTVAAMKKEGRTFKGCLYFGLMLTKDGPRVIEYNCRFGDPEAQVVLPLLESDLFTVMQAVAHGNLAEVEVTFSEKSACCVVLASRGYPQRYETGFEVVLPQEKAPGVDIFTAGTKLSEGRLVSAGGRVLSVTATADTLAAAIERAYEAVGTIRFENGYCRRDIGRRALLAGK